MPQLHWDQPGLTYDAGLHYDSDVAPTTVKKMKAKVSLNLRSLDARGQLAKLQTAITKLTGNAALPNPNPSLIISQAAHDAAQAKLDLIDAKEQELVQLRLERDAAMEAAMDIYDQLGSFVENKSNGDPVIITGGGYDTVGERQPAPPVGQVMNLRLTHGDQEGWVDVAWNRIKSARSYMVELSADPLGPNTWQPNQIAPRSTCTIKGLTLGAKVWVRVRAVGGESPGLWSDPATIIVV
jgi:hypothetical protein